MGCPGVALRTRSCAAAIEKYRAARAPQGLQESWSPSHQDVCVADAPLAPVDAPGQSHG